ncbi:phenoloxidase-activating factor 1-like [Drosophila takahashii]|uniref:phenoloxidase-activating factor 1-like n=1 Tax=Drosophila takahashii TaxID=29030 RepID=UPI003899361D
MFLGIQLCYLIFYILSHFLSSIHGQNECGKLRESQLYNQKKITEPDEYAWIGLVGYGDEGPRNVQFKCLSVLINSRYAILPAQCVTDPEFSNPLIIVFGEWQAKKSSKSGVCRLEEGFRQCAPPSQTLDIEELVVHPGYLKSHELKYNLALAKLDRDVELSEFVHPICLPPAEGDKENHIAQILHMAGFRRSGFRFNWKEDDYFRQKIKVTTTSLRYCLLKILIPIGLTENNLCAVKDTQYELFPGSPLMGIDVVDGNPQNFYLVGILITSLGNSESETELSILLRLAPFRTWILNNIQN